MALLFISMLLKAVMHKLNSIFMPFFLSQVKSGITLPIFTAYSFSLYKIYGKENENITRPGYESNISFFCASPGLPPLPLRKKVEE